MNHTDQPKNEAEYSQYLVERILEGDNAAETLMVNRYHSRLRVQVRQRSQDWSVADDVIQETWIVVIRRVRQNELRDRTKLAAFIAQIGRNQVLMHFRSKSKEPLQMEDPDSVQLPSLSPEQSLENKQLGHAIDGTLNKMSQERDRQLIYQALALGVEKTELCKTFSVSSEHYDRVIFRARKRFKDTWVLFQDEGEDDDE